MKIECIKSTIDLDKVYFAICRFKAEHSGNRPSYIIMSYKTGVELRDEMYYYHTVKFDNLLGTDTLFDIPIAFNNGLKFGEIDIV